MICWYFLVQDKGIFEEDHKIELLKGWARRIDINKNRLSYLRILYSIRLAKQLNEDILIINVDEVNFSPEVLNWRSWLKIGINWEIFSQKYSRTIPVIWAIPQEEIILPQF